VARLVPKAPCRLSGENLANPRPPPRAPPRHLPRARLTFSKKLYDLFLIKNAALLRMVTDNLEKSPMGRWSKVHSRPVHLQAPRVLLKEPPHPVTDMRPRVV